MDDASYEGTGSEQSVRDAPPAGKASSRRSRPSRQASAKPGPADRSVETQPALIRFPAMDTSGPFTGERYLSSVPGPIQLEHYHRYIFARVYCEGKDVLDIASGEGYGSAFLSEVAKSVTGVDIDAQASATAAQAYKRDNLTFKVGSTTDIPLANASVDTIVSFETLEHFEDQDDFFVECKRVLRPGGVIIVSTPDRIVFSPPGSPPNPYHLKELTREEFEALLSRHFDDFSIIGQSPVIGSVIGPSASPSAIRVLDEIDDRTYSRSNGPTLPMYLIAVIGAPISQDLELLNGARSGLPLFAASAQKASVMENEVVRLHTEIGYREAEIGRLGLVEVSLRSEIQQALDRGGELMRDNDRLRREVNDLTQSATRTASETHAAQLSAATAIWEREAKIISLSANLEALKAVLGSELTIGVQQVVAAQVEATKLRATRDTLVGDLEKERECRSSLQGEFATLSLAHEASASRLAEMESALTDIKKQRTQLNTELAIERDLRVSASIELAAIVEAHKAAMGRVHELEVRNFELTDLVGSLENSLDQANEKVEASIAEQIQSAQAAERDLRIGLSIELGAMVEAHKAAMVRVHELEVRNFGLTDLIGNLESSLDQADQKFEASIAEQIQSDQVASINPQAMSASHAEQIAINESMRAELNEQTLDRQLLQSKIERLQQEATDLRLHIDFLEQKRAEGAEHVRGLERFTTSLADEIGRRQVTIEEIRSSTTWKLARGFAKIGAVAPTSVKSVVRRGLTKAVHTSQARKQARQATAETRVVQTGHTASAAPTLLRQERPVEAFVPPGVPIPTAPLAARIAAPPAQFALEPVQNPSRPSVSVIVSVPASLPFDDSFLAFIEALAADGTEVIYSGLSPRRLKNVLSIPGANAESEAVALIDQLIRASAAPTVILLTAPVNVTTTTIRDAALVFSNNPTIVAANGLVTGRNSSPTDPALKAVHVVDSLKPGLVIFDADAYVLVGGLEPGASNLGDALRHFSQKAQAAGFSVAVDPFTQAHSQQPQPSPSQRSVMKTNGARRPRALFCDLVTPTPDRDCGSLNLVWNIRILQAMGYDCVFMPNYDRKHAGRYTDELRRMSVPCILAEDYGEPWQYLQAEGHNFDVVLLYRVGSACHLIDPVRRFAPQAKVIFVTVDLHFLREGREALLANSVQMLEASEATKREELRVMTLADVTTIVSLYEMDLLKEIHPTARTAWIPIVNPVAGLMRPAAGRKGVMFVGGFGHRPNKDGVLFFAKSIWPRVRQLVPDAQFYVIGSTPPPEISELHSEANGVNIMGFVEDLGPWYREMKMNVAPLRFGGGVKGKVISALSVGLPTVGTSIAVEGMGLVHGTDVMVADDPEAFAQHVAKLYSDDAVWEDMARASVATARKIYSVEAIADSFTAVFKDLSLPH